MLPSRTGNLLALLLLAACALLASGCKDDRAARDRDIDATGSEAALPKPEVGAGSVTGLPGAAAGGARAEAPVAAAEDPFDLGEDGTVIATEGDADDAGMEDVAAPGPAETTPAQPVAEPTADDAATVVRIYYGAIDAGEYERAYQLWSGGGRSTGQSAAEFAGGFASTTGVSVQTGTPGRIEGAAGSRYVTVPVTIQASHEDGSNHRYAGTYTLRRAVVDGASDDQRSWRIDSADLRELP